MKSEQRPHVKRRGKLKNNNPPGDFMSAQRCGAKTRRGSACLAPAMKNGRCRLHGGKSTGPKTEAGIQRIREAHLKDGLHTKTAVGWRRESNRLIREYKEALREIERSSEYIKLKIYRKIDI